MLALSACSAAGTASRPTSSPQPTATVTPTLSPSPTPLPTDTPPPTPTSTPVPPTPTPDPPRTNTPDLSKLGAGWAAFSYTLQAGEDLGTLAARYGLSYDQIRAANGFVGGETLYPGQVILIPQVIKQAGPSFKIISDSEAVYGPGVIGFDTVSFVAGYPDGYLNKYTEMVDGIQVGGAALVQRAAENYSVNPRLLLALLEYQSGWLTQSDPTEKLYPFGRAEGGTEGLYRQLQWATNALNRGFYEWRDGSLSLLILSDGTRVGIDPELNAGTAAAQYVFALTRKVNDWQTAVGPDGLYHTYSNLFGYPFAYAVEPLIPESLSQPALSLPWQTGETWFFSGGPHASFGPGSPWGAIDFLPPGKQSGCAVSPYWVTAMAPGVVARSNNGQLLLDLDGDGFEQTGWVILYLHIAAQDRAPAGLTLTEGNPIGHPSCEGGRATGTHAHVARRYNGEWIPADGALPFVLSGWTAHAGDTPYKGTLTYDFPALKITACTCVTANNSVTR